MNNYYQYGYAPYPGQPPYGFPAPMAPAPPYSAPAFPPPNNAFDVHVQPRPHEQQYEQPYEQPYDQPYEQPYDQQPYDQNQSLIPGLGYGQPSAGFGWQHQPPQAPPPPTQQWPPREEPNLIPASRYYQSSGPAKETSKTKTHSQRKLKSGPHTKPAVQDVEEGELSEEEIRDVYEPADIIMEPERRQPAGNNQSLATPDGRGQNGVNAMDAVPAAVPWNGVSNEGMTQSPPTADIAARDRSRSYSPHLSPREMNPSVVHERAGKTSNGQATKSPRSANAQESSAIMDAKKKAQAAILNLWPLNVRYQQYVEEGIDETVVKGLFADLGLDIGTPREPAGTAVSTPSQPSNVTKSTEQPSSKAPGLQTPASLPNAAAQEQASSAKSAGEERKDRIARLLAAKGTKPAASTSNNGPQADAKTSMSDKELKQQQKMDALQKSREARAQKAAERKGSLQAPQTKETPTSVAPYAPSAPAGDIVGSSVPPPVPQSAPPPATAPQPQAASTSSIPGLFLSSQPAPVLSQRKRPVAADFVSSSQASKRPFGHNVQDKPLVIDVSDVSDDEDVEMEIGSPSDEPSSIQPTDTPSFKTASFREFPPLTDGRPQLSPASSNAATPPSGVISAQPKQAHLEVMDKQIEAMKRKIALAEARRKLKAAMSGQASVQKTSAAQTPEAAIDSDTNKPSIRRVQSMEAASGSDQARDKSSPVPHDAGASMRLPKPSDKRTEGGASRAEKLRAVSTSIPLVENRLQAKKSKLRLLQSQIARLQKEIEEEDAEKQKLAQEMEQLNQESDEEPIEPQNLPKSTSVDPVVSRPPTGTQSDVDATLAPASGANDAGASAASTAVAFKSQSPIPQPSENTSPSAEEVVDSAVTGKAAATSPETPVVPESAVPDVNEAPASQGARADEIEESRPASSSSEDSSDVVMGESDEPGSQEEEQESSDAYEPPDDAKSTSVGSADSDVLLENSDTDLQHPSSKASPVPAQISLGVNESTPEQGVDAVREASPAPGSDGVSSGDRFTPYESPLQYFRAYRYHPQFAETVAGGLRSLTYSNRIDPNLPVCPDQLASKECPRGANCIYQHFESMKLPDDQILLQLGGPALDGEEKVKYNEGLRKLLQEMRMQNIKDFPSIAQGIVDFHGRFTGDPSKILPLGDVSI